jgi:hypothetical protein
MVKYCATAGEVKRIRSRIRLRLRMMTASKHRNELE